MAYGLEYDINDKSHIEQDQLTELAQTYNPDYTDGKRICGQYRWYMDTKETANHLVSDLAVRRKENNTYVLVAYVTFYDQRWLSHSILPRPRKWLEIDFITGTLIAEHLCENLDFAPPDLPDTYNFCPTTYKELQEFKAANLPKNGQEVYYDLSQQYYRQAYNLLDMVRLGWLQGKGFNLSLYQDYCNTILKNIHPVYQVFFRHLSDPLGEKSLYSQCN